MQMDDLKKQKIWVCWNYKTRKGNRTKVPITIYGAPTGAKAVHALTWVTYEEAAKAKEERGYDGVMFRLPKGCFFLDIDHRKLEDPVVQKMLERFDSYAEYSTSGEGFHIYGTCDISRIPTCMNEKGEPKLHKDFYTNKPGSPLELYFGDFTNQFAVYTGNVVRDVPFKECTNAVLVTLDKDMRRNKKKVRYSEKRDGGDEELFDIVANLRKQKNGAKFSKLYDQGDFSDYKSQSEADCALCAMIAFRTGPDPGMIDTVFRSSALYREKWEREDYSANTIERGIEACDGVFHRSRMEHPAFIRFKEKTGDPYIMVPLLARYIREHLQYILVRDNGKHGLLKYVYEGGCYRLFSNDMLMGVIKQYIADYDEELVKMSQVNETLQHITTDLHYVGQDELDSDESLINFQNGLLRVTATETMLMPHSPAVYSTIQLPCEWTGCPMPTPVFDSYMNTLTDGDAEITELLLQFIGVCLSNVKGWRLKKALFLVGDGDTGKSQLKSLVERLLGKGNFIGIDLKEIEARFGTGAIYGTRLAGSSDMSFLSVVELKTFKKITGGDSLYAEFKGQQAFEFTYNGLLWFCMNRLPRFGGDNGQWVYDRIMVVHCPNIIPKEKQDKQVSKINQLNDFTSALKYGNMLLPI